MTPDLRMWTRDFQALLALPRATRDAVEELIYSRYPDEGWPEEYRFSLWNAWVYLKENGEYFEEKGLTIITPQGSLLKDALLMALYRPFIECPLEEMGHLNIAPGPIAEEALRLLNSSPPRP